MLCVNRLNKIEYLDIMLSFSEYLIESKKKRPLHLFEDGEMTFGQIRDVVEDLFKSDVVEVVPRKPVVQVGITCKDGKVLGVLNGLNPAEPVVSENLMSGYKASKEFKEAFGKAMDGIESKISELSIEEQDEIFDKGKRFAKFNIISPASNANGVENFKEGRMLVFPAGCAHYSDDFSAETPLTEAESDYAQRVLSIFSKVNNDKTKTSSNLDPFAQELYKLTKENAKCFAKCPDRKEAVQEVATLLNELIDGLGYRATLNDYIKERYERKIVNAATKAGLEIKRSSDFVSEMVDRLSTMTAKRPTKSDLATYAKREGVDIGSKEYKEFLDTIESTLDTDNYEMLKPVSKLLNRILVLFLKSLLGYASMCDSKLQNMLTVALEALESTGEMTEANTAILKKLFVKLREFANTHKNGDDFVVANSGKPYTIKCKIPDIESLGSKILKA